MYAARELGAERKMMTNFVLIRSDGDQEEEIWVGKVLLLVFRVVRGMKNCHEMAVVQFMECVSPLDAVDKALECLCLRWAASEGGDDESDVDR